MAERWTWERVSLVLKFWKGRGDEFAPETVKLLAERDDAAKRSREKVDVDEVYRQARGRVSPDFLPAEAVRVIEDAEMAADVAPKSARLADLEAAGYERAIPAVFVDEMRAAVPTMRESFAAAVESFAAAVKGIPATVTDSQKAEAAGQQWAHLWHEANAAANTIAWLWRISADMREAGITPTVPAARAEDWRWQQPDRVPSVRASNNLRRHQVDHLRDALARGAGPALITFDELRARISREAADAAAATAAARRKAGGTHTGVPGDPYDAVRAAVDRAKDRHPGEFVGVA